MTAGNGTSPDLERFTARVVLGTSMSAFAVIATLGNVLFWFALIYDKRVSSLNESLKL